MADATLTSASGAGGSQNLEFIEFLKRWLDDCLSVNDKERRAEAIEAMKWLVESYYGYFGKSHYGRQTG